METLNPITEIDLHVNSVGHLFLEFELNYFNNVINWLGFNSEGTFHFLLFVKGVLELKADETSNETSYFNSDRPGCYVFFRFIA